MPAAFVERLDQAEDYLNERLAASGEIWQLDAKTRVMLGLPPTKSGATLPDLKVNAKQFPAFLVQLSLSRTL